MWWGFPSIKGRRNPASAAGHGREARQDLSGEKGRAEQLSERLTVERADLTARIEATTGGRDQAQERARTAEAQAAELRGELAALRKR